MVMKIDLKKEYNQYIGFFLEGLLQTVGSNDNLVRVIMSCLRSTNILVIWNGLKLGNFKPDREISSPPPICIMHGVLGHHIWVVARRGEWRTRTMAIRGSYCILSLLRK